VKQIEQIRPNVAGESSRAPKVEPQRNVDATMWEFTQSGIPATKGHDWAGFLVGVAGFEPATPASRTRLLQHIALKNLYLWFCVRTIAPIRSWCSRGYSGVGPARAGSLSIDDFPANCWQRLSVPTEKVR